MMRQEKNVRFLARDRLCTSRFPRLGVNLAGRDQTAHDQKLYQMAPIVSTRLNLKSQLLCLRFLKYSSVFVHGACKILPL